jgi:hypothetical protein
VSDRELLTECLEALTHDAAQRTFAGGVRMSQLAIKLRAALAAPRPEPEPVVRVWLDADDPYWLDKGYSTAPLYAAPPAAAPSEDIEALRRENERLRVALGKYGRHLDDCALTLGGYQCTCGFNQQEVPR